MTRVVLLLSGGYDSVAMIPFLQRKVKADIVYGLFIQHGQPQVANEHHAVLAAAKRFGINAETMTIGGLVTRRDGYVPGRNLVLLSLAAAFAESVAYDTVAFGAIAGSAHRRGEAGYALADTSSAFLKLAVKTMAAATKTKVKLVTPFADWTKPMIRAWLAKQNLASVVSEVSWSCRKAGPTPCGECISCVDRIKDKVDHA